MGVYFGVRVRSTARSSFIIVLIVLLAASMGSAIGGVPEARAEVPAPAVAAASDPTADDPSTVTADALPTVQINGNVLDQEIVGDIVYAAGTFSSARPAGSPAGSNEVARSNLLAYRLSTGELIASFAPTTNGQVRSVEASPDGTRLYVVGDFTTVNGQTRNHVAAFDLPSGNLSSFNPNSNGTTIGVDATNSTVYITGNFGRVSGQDRLGAAAVTRDGALLPWAPVLGERRGRVVVVSPDGTKVVLGGDFPTLNGSSNPGYGLAMVSATDGALIVPFQTNDVIRNAGKNAAIFSLKTDADSFYGTGYVYGDGGNLEGSFRASWDTGALTWVNDCHGDEYDVQPIGEVVYAAGHSHYCGSLEGGFPQADPWSFYRAIAVTKSVARITPSGLNLGYFDFGGNPAPKLLQWFPTFNTGTVSGAYQGPWTVNGNSEYLVYGGEFTKVNGAAQQGIVRFAVPSKATNAQGPVLAGTQWPAVAQPLDGSIRVSWPLNYDRDDEYLTYEVLRNNVVIKTFDHVRSKSSDWGLPPMAYVDASVEAGKSYTYRIRVKDPAGHAVTGGAATATASGASSASAYRDVVLADAPLDYWPLDDSTDSVSYDWAGASDLAVRNGVTRGVTGAILGESRTAASFDGGSNGFATTTTAIAGPNSFGVEAWFKTTSTSGGKIIGFGNSTTGNSSSYDRHVYMEPDGRISFGVYPGSSQTVQSSSSYNDGQWHQVAAGLSGDGMVLYIDGVRVAQRTDVTTAQAYNGFWRIGGDASWSGSDRFAGQVDEVAVYGAPLSKSQVATHYTASGRTLEGSNPPADAYGASVYALDPALYWRLDETSGTTAADASGNSQRGTYVGDVRQGAAGALPDAQGTAAEFGGGQVISQKAFVNPRSYSLEAWFKTSTVTGGKIIGFGNSATGNSSSYDRQVYMTDSGTLIYGVWTGTERKLETTASYNDGQWHHVVATQGAEGMRLFVDGEAAGSNTESGAQDFTGYWHVGGDVTWGPGDNEFDGALDEVAVYMAPMSAADAAAHYALGSAGELPNAPPTANFTSSTNKLALAVDASSSSDADGTIDTYSWDWGDGSAPGEGMNASHTYAAGGSYTVTLTVTDDRGGTASTSAIVAVVPNQPPVVSFTTSADALTLKADASASSDPDGSIATFSWDWGDGVTEEAEATASHTYAEAGSYTVTLTVADDDGETASSTANVAVARPTGATVYAQDEFNRTVANGLGTADTGGDWTLSNTASNYRVDGSTAVFVQPSGGSQRFAYLPSVESTDTAVDVDVMLSALPVGGSAYYTAHVRRVGAADYRARIIVASTGRVTVQLQQTSTVLANVPTSIDVAAGDQLHIRAEAAGTSPTALRVKVWKVGTPEPADWTATSTDSTAALQAPGHVGLGVYLGASVTNVPLQTRFDNFKAASIAETETPPEDQNQEPRADFTITSDGRSVSTDASASSDDDGTIASYVWDFGDGQTGTGKTASHTYAEDGTFTVSLTVKDDDGAEATTTRSVTVAAPASDNEPPTAAFTAQTSALSVDVDASGSADADGSIAEYVWDFGDGETGTGVTATHAYDHAGTYTVSLTVTDDIGAQDTISHDVDVTSPPADGPVAQDDFGRPNGLLGDAPVGGTWAQTAGVANVSVDNDRARLTMQNASQTRTAALPEAVTDSADMTFTFATSGQLTGGRLYVSALGRVVGAQDYRARWLIDPNGAVQAQLSRGSTVMTWVNLAGLTIEPETTYRVRLQVFGTGGTTVRSKIWKDGDAEPASWQLSTTDSTAELQAAGHTGVSVYSGGAFLPKPFSLYVDNYTVEEVSP